MEDTLSYSGALRLSRVIENYWATRGYQVEVVLEKISLRHLRVMWVIRSNMINGHPQKKISKH